VRNNNTVKPTLSIKYPTCFGGTRCRWEDNIKMDLQKEGRGVMTGSIWLRIGTGG
jgi:hypothetical protein